jgi:hypothetical protein
VLPVEGKKCWVAIRKSESGEVERRQQFCDSIEQLEAALRGVDSRQWNAFFACAAFKTADNRKHENALGAKAIWLDIDAGAGKPYADADEAVAAVDDFCEKTNLPLPTILYSGNGVHAWWTFEKIITAATWERLAQAFKGLTKHHGLHADPVRTADISSILRGPQTYNWKDPANPRAATCDELMPMVDPLEFCKAVAVVVPTQPAPPQLAPATIDIGKAATENLFQAQPSFAAKAVEKCGQLKHMRDTKGNIQEPLWYANLCVLAQCEDGKQYAHEWSSGHAKYSAVETDEKLSHALASSGPTTCAKFKDINPEGCKGCPFSVTSPIVLGRGHMLPYNAPAIPVDARPILPQGYFWGPNMELLTKVKNPETLEMEPTVISKHPIYLSAVRQSDKRSDKTGYVFTKWYPHEGWKEFEIDAYDFKASNWSAHMAARGAHIKTSSEKMFKTYVDHAQEILRDTVMDQTRYEQFGWNSDYSGFVLGDRIFRSDGALERVGITEAAAMRARLLTPYKNGSLDKWTGLASRLFQTAKMEPQQFALICSFAAPLMTFASKSDGGAILSLVSPDTGKGKSTVLSAAASVWGRREGMELKNEDTLVAKFASISLLRHLPVMFDELHLFNADLMQSFVRTFTGGRDKDRGWRDGTINKAPDGWQTILICATNGSVLDQLSVNTADPQAARVFEVLMEDVEFSHSGAFGDLIVENCGHAGQAYMRYIAQQQAVDYIRRKDDRPGELDKMIEHYSSKLSTKADHRFMIRLMATAHITAHFVDHLRLIEFKPDYIIGWARERMEDRVRETVVYDAWSVVRNCINGNFSDCLVVTDRFHPQKPIQVKHEPKRALRMRMELAPKRLYISVDAIRQWLLDSKKSYNSVVKQLEKDGLLVSRNRLTKLGAGTTLMSVAEPCWELDVSNPAVSGDMALVVDNNLQEAKQL